MAESEAAYTANDAVIRVDDADTQLEKAAAAVEYYDRELACAMDAVERIQAKREQMQAFINEVNSKVESAKVEVQRIQAERDAAVLRLETLRSGNGVG